MELTDFLLARIDEDEAVARAVNLKWWPPSLDDRNVGNGLYLQPEKEFWADGDFVRWFAPARILAECAAKRVLISLCQTPDPHAPEEAGDGCTECAVLYTMAAVYSSHADYQPGWRP